MKIHLAECKNIETIIIPKYVRTIGSNAFGNSSINVIVNNSGVDLKLPTEKRWVSLSTDFIVTSIKQDTAYVYGHKPTYIPGEKLEIVTPTSNSLIIDDEAYINIAGVDTEKLLLKGKSGTYDATTGMFKAIKKGTAKLYYLDGKKKIMACTIIIEQPKLKPTLKIKKGKPKKIKLTGTKRTDVTWSSNDPSVNVANGFVTGTKLGNYKITASIGNHTWSCDVIIK